MAAKQKEKLDEQQKMLFKNTQRSSVLRLQQQKHKDQMRERNERLNLMRERIKEKEAKLKKLRLLKNLVQDQTNTNAICVKELGMMKSSFKKKEQELASVIEKMEMLAEHLKQLREERSLQGVTEAEVSSLNRKKELYEQIMEHNSLNRQHAEKLRHKQEILILRQKQVAEFVEKAKKYQTRLSSSRQKVKQTLSKSLTNLPVKENSDVFKHKELVVTVDPISKYKTLPHSLKFTDIEQFNGALELAGKEKAQKVGQTADVIEKQASDASRESFALIGLQHSSTGLFSEVILQNQSTSGIKSTGGEYQTAETVKDLPSTVREIQISPISKDKSDLGLGIGAKKHSSHLLMTHFAPRPYESKCSSVKSYVCPVVSPFNVSLTKKTDLSFGALHKTEPAKTDLLTKPESDSHEILITDPPSRIPHEQASDLSSGDGSIKQQQMETRSSQKVTDGHVLSWFSSSYKQNNSSSEVIPLSSDSQSREPEKPLHDGMLMGKSLACKPTENEHTSGSDHSFLHHVGELPISRPPKQKSQSFDETFSVSSEVHSSGVQVKNVTRSNFYKTVAHENFSKESSAILSSPKSVRPSILQILNSKLGRNPTKQPLSSAVGCLSATDFVAPANEPTSELVQPFVSKSISSQSSDPLLVEPPLESGVRDLKAKRVETSLEKSHHQEASLDLHSGLSRLDSMPLKAEGITEPLDAKKLESLDSTSRKSALINCNSLKTSDAKSESKVETSRVIAAQASLPDSGYSLYAVRNFNAKTCLIKQETNRMHGHDVAHAAGSGSPLWSSERNSKPGPTSEERRVRDMQSTTSLDSRTANIAEDYSVSSKKCEEGAVDLMADVRSSCLMEQDLERLVHKPVVPRPVRRRMSSNDMSEDYPNKFSSRYNDAKPSLGDVTALPNCISDGVGGGALDCSAAPNASLQHALGNNSSAAAPDYLLDSLEKTSFVKQPFRRQGNLKRAGKPKLLRRVSFEPLALLLDASLEGELDVVEKTAREVPDVSASNDEGITALHNAICAGHFNIVKFLVEFGCDVNAPDSDGWTPLHCAASCNNLAMTQFLVEHGACIFASTFSDQELASDKCEEDEEGYDTCCQYLRDIQDRMGFINDSIVYALFNYEAENPDELTFRSGDRLLVLRKGDDCEQEWWWSCLGDREGYVPRNLVGLFPRVVPQWIQTRNRIA